MDIDLKKSFKISLELDCNQEDFQTGTVFDITLKDEGRAAGLSVNKVDEILQNSSSNATSRIRSNERTLTQIFRSGGWTFTQL